MLMHPWGSVIRGVLLSLCGCSLAGAAVSFSFLHAVSCQYSLTTLCMETPSGATWTFFEWFSFLPVVHISTMQINCWVSTMTHYWNTPSIVHQLDPASVSNQDYVIWLKVETPEMHCKTNKHKFNHCDCQKHHVIQHHPFLTVPLKNSQRLNKKHK